jgi:hypothetical protein
MNSDRDRLLSDILTEPGDTRELRDALLNRTLRYARRRRLARRVEQVGGVLMLLLALAQLWQVHVPRGSKMANRVPYALVRTAPLPRASLIETQPFAASGLVASAPSLSIVSISTRSEERGYREIDDAALLALAGTNAAVLVRLGPHSAELVLSSGTMEPHIAN